MNGAELNGGPRARVLHLIDSLRLGGKERQTVELVKGLARDGRVEQMVAVIEKFDKVDPFYRPDIEALGIPLIYLLRKTRRDVSIFPRLNKVLRDFRPDIVHSNSGMAVTYALPWCRARGIKIVNGTIRNAFQGSGPRWQWSKWMLRLSDARVANSRAGFASRGLNAGKPGNFVIYNGFDLARFDQAATATGATLGFEPGGRKIVGMVAEFSSYKDYPTFIRAAEKILARRKDAVFVMVGDGPMLAECQAMVSAEKAEHIRFLGRRKNVESLILRMDVGALCTFTEGISNAIMEFMAASKPVVVTDGGGSGELIAHGEHGFLVRSGDDAAVAERIESLLDDPALAAQMGAAGRRRLETCFSLEQLVEKNLKMYDLLLNTRSKWRASSGGFETAAHKPQ